MTSSRLLRRLRRSEDDGFTLVEILVAMTLFALMTTAAVPMVITGLRASTVAKLDTGAKNLAQERMEAMRNLPYHVSAVAATPTSTDVLDTYYANLTAAPSTSSAGFVSATAARGEHEPAGAFYRTVWDLNDPELGPYTQTVATQFLNAAGAPVTPPTGWNRQTEGVDAPPSLTIGVTVVTHWAVGRLSKSLAVFTEMGQGRSDAPLVTLVNRTTALTVTSTLGGSDLLLQAGQVSLDGVVTSGANAASSALGAYAALNPGTRVDGATRSVSAPPSVAAGSTNGGTQALTDGSGTLASFGVTNASGVGASTAQGLPAAGTSSTPVTARIDSGQPLWFTNRPAPVNAGLLLNTAAPVVSVLNTAGGNQVVGTGWFSTGPDRATGVGVTSSASVRTLKVLPTTFAPDGVLQVTLLSSSATCSSSTSSVAGEVEYTAQVRYWTADNGTGVPGYVTVAGDAGAVDSLGAPLVTSDDTTDALAVVMAADPLVNGTQTLSSYVSHMSGKTQSELTAAVAVQDARTDVSLPSVLSITTQPLRSDDLSQVTVDLGSFSCTAEDRR